MQITLNGKETEVKAPCTVAELLEQRELAATACAVEVNAELVPKRRHTELRLQERDTVEIVTLVGGG